jgi:L-fucose mutarotase
MGANPLRLRCGTIFRSGEDAKMLALAQGHSGESRNPVVSTRNLAALPFFAPAPVTGSRPSPGWRLGLGRSPEFALTKGENMLKGIPPIVGPDLLYVLQAMGHGDQITIVDGNYPGESAGPRLVRMDGHSATEVLDAVLTLMPLDDFVDDPAISMQVVGDAGRREPIMDEFEAIVKKHEPKMGLTSLERFAFYKRANAGYAIVQTGERRLYGNIILKKGVIRS